jgi:molybdopterin-synthase adenylyltransferase
VKTGWRRDVRLVRRDAAVWGLERGGLVAWVPAAVAQALWAGAPGVLTGELADTLARLGFLGPPAVERDEGVDRNEVFASALCGERGPVALRVLAERDHVVVGCGGLGASTAVQLAALGAQRLTLIDRDRVECSNLNRLLWSEPTEVGSKKVESLARHLRARFGVNARAVGDTATEESLDALFGPRGPGPSTWLLTIDQAPAARAVARWLHGRQGVQYVHAGYVGAQCVAGPLVVDVSDPCPFCGSGAVPASTESFVAPSAAPNNLMIAAFLAAQLLRLAAAGAEGTVLHRRRWVLDLRTGDASVTPVFKRSDCEVCGVDR